MSDVLSTVEADVDKVEEAVISEARKARKEAQLLVEKAREALANLEDAITGRGGLSAEQKVAQLNAANTAAQELTTHAQEATNAVQRAVAAS